VAPFQVLVGLGQRHWHNVCRSCTSPASVTSGEKPALSSEALRSPVAPGIKLFRFISGDRMPAPGTTTSQFSGSPIASDMASMSNTAASPRRCDFISSGGCIMIRRNLKQGAFRPMKHAVALLGCLGSQAEEGVPSVSQA
jgi:hypothetical protein